MVKHLIKKGLLAGVLASALTISSLTPMMVYATDVETFALQADELTKAITTSENITVEALDPTGGFNVDGWSVNESGGVKFESCVESGLGGKSYSNGLLKITIPSSTEMRTLKFDMVYDNWNRDYVYIYSDDPFDTDGTMLKEFTYDGGSTISVDIGTTKTDFYLRTDNYSGMSFIISNMRVEETETIYEVGSSSTAKIKKGVMTISGSGEIDAIVNIPEGVREAVTSVVIEDGITSIDSTFEYRGFGIFPNMKSVSLPETLIFIGEYAFSGCKKLESITFPDSLEDISNYAFKDCDSLTELNIDNNLCLGSGAFFDCDNIAKIYYNSTFYNSGFGISVNQGGTWVSEYFYNAGNAVSNGVDIEIGPDVSEVPEGLFLGISKINSIKIPDTVTVLGSETHPDTGYYNIFAALDTTDEVAVITTNQVALDYNWEKDGLNVNITDEEFTSSSGEGGIFSNNNLYEVEVGHTLQLNGRVTDLNRTYTWIISNLDENETEKVATIDKKGAVTGLKPGWALVAIADSRNVIVAQVTICVIPEGVTYGDWIRISGNQLSYGGTALSPGGSYGFNVGGYTLSNGQAGGIGGGYTVDSSGISVSGAIDSSDLDVYVPDAIAGTKGVTVTGTVTSISNLDISIPLNSLSFSIDGDRNFHSETTYIENNCNCPIEVYIVNIAGKNGDEPALVAENKYTEKQWNNLNKEETLSQMALKINDLEMYPIYNNTELDKTHAIKVGNIESGFNESKTLGMTPSAQYGKNFGNSETLTLEYNVVFEFRIP